MQYCRICRFPIKAEINIYKETLGEPPVLLIDLIKECTQDYFRDDDIGEDNIYFSYICHECCQKLLLYYNSSVMMKKLKDELYKLMESAARRSKLFDEDNLKVVDTKVETEKTVSSHFSDINSFNDKTSDLLERNEEHDEKEQLVKLEIIAGNTQILIERDENEFEFENVSTILKTEIPNDKYEPCEELIEIEQINIDELSKNTLEETGREKANNCLPPRKALSCSDCKILFPNKRTYSMHRKQEHFSGYICDQCGKTFYSQSGFITHTHTHKPEKEFVCPVCGQQYHHKGYLKRHMAWHSGETPFECDVCSKRFVHKVALYRHKQIHEDVRNIECVECGFKFRTKAHLNRHMMTHSGAKPHSCPICGQCFSQMYNMKVHLREHESPGSTRRNRIKCKNCSKTFSHKDKFDSHMKRKEC